MKVSLSWLREFVPIELDTPALCERLTLGGLAVDGVEELGAEIRSVVVGEIISTAPHPHAERLTLCEVRTGPGPTASVVCGATNMKAGDRVAYAPPGSVLPGERRIDAAVIRGVASDRMLCQRRSWRCPTTRRASWSWAPTRRSVSASAWASRTRCSTSTSAQSRRLPQRARDRARYRRSPARACCARAALRERGRRGGDAVAVRIEDPAGCARYTRVCCAA